MSGNVSPNPIRFLHASDFRLELPVLGVTHLPDHLRETLIEAPYRAARRVFDAAVTERVDFVVLSGNIINPSAAGPRGVQFLQTEFERLAREQISVYWSCGPSDRMDLWPPSVPMPSNVQVFAGDRIASVTHRRDDQAIATIQASGYRRSHTIRSVDFPGCGNRFSIAVAYGAGDPKAMRTSQINYWALGGRHERYTLFSSPRTAQYSGSPQGRSPDEVDVHGCTLVDVDDTGTVNRQMIPTDVVRWHTERLELPDHMDSQGLLRLLRERLRQLSHTHSEQLVMVSWQVVDSDQLTDTRSDLLAAQLRQSDLPQEIVGTLRKEFGMSVPGIWTVSLTADTPSVYPAGWYEEDTVLGDLLRAVQYFQNDRDQAVELEGWASETPLSPELVNAMGIRDAADRDYVLRHVAALGVDLLRGDRVLSEELASIPALTVDDREAPV